MPPPFKYFPLPLKLFLMVSLLLVCLGTTGYVAYLSIHGLFGVEKPEEVVAGKFTGIADINAFLYIQAATSLGGFLLSAWLFALLDSGHPNAQLRLHARPTVRHLLLAVATIVVAQFFIEFLVEVNSRLPLKEIFGAGNDRQAEIEKITEQVLNFKSPWRLVLVSLVMAVVPAISEEFFFRGLLLGSFLRHGVSAGLSIAVSGLVFALFHFEYNNTLAIWVLGAFLGYLYYITGSLWVPVLAHFTNNFMAVLLKYLHNVGVISTDVFNAETPWYLTVVSVLLFGGSVYLFYRWRSGVNYFYTPSTITEPTQPNHE